MLHLIIADVAPASRPLIIGQHWIDKTHRREWRSFGTVQVSDWVEEVFTTTITEQAVTGWFLADNFDAMRALAVASTNKVCITKGLTTPRDNGGRTYVWYNDSTATDDGIKIAKPNGLDDGDPGRWEQL